MNILSLPVEVTCGGILPHLSLCDLQALDTAFTNKYLRPQLQKVWESYQYDAFDVVWRQHEFVWLCRSGVQIVSLSIDGFVSYIPTLKKLNITSCVGDMDIWKLATTCGNLHVLYVNSVYGRNVDEAVSALAQNCRQLHTLHIRSNDLTDAGISALAQHCAQLHTLHIRNAQISDAGIQALCENCPFMKHISVNVSVSDCFSITDASLIAIANSYSHLASISLYSDKFTDDGLISFADKCHELRSVSVRCKHITSRGLTALWAANPNLIDVDISFNDFISDDDIIQLAQCCPLLQKLNMCCCYGITDAAVIAVAEHCPQLRSLDINHCYEVSDASLIALGQHCHELKSIDISYLYKKCNVGIAALAAGCPLLLEFYAFDTNTTDASVVALARGCRDLHKIVLSDCKHISIDGVSAIAENCPLISELLLSCCKVDDACLYVIAQHCRNLTVLHITGNAAPSADAVISVINSCRMLRRIECSYCFRHEEDRKAIKEYAGGKLVVHV